MGLDATPTRDGKLLQKKGKEKKDYQVTRIVQDFPRGRAENIHSCGNHRSRAPLIQTARSEPHKWTDSSF